MRGARTLALAGGSGFHLGIYLTLDINFTSYLVCYALFVDWRVLTTRFHQLWLARELRRA